MLITVAADLAERRRARGLKLNYPEAVAMLSSFVLEGARDGRTVAELMSSGRDVLCRDDVMPRIALGTVLGRDAAIASDELQQLCADFR